MSQSSQTLIHYSTEKTTELVTNTGTLLKQQAENMVEGTQNVC